MYVEQPEELEARLKIGISRDILTARLRRAIHMKRVKMQRVDPSLHVWYTYWLIIVEETQYGAGLAGFKGGPDSQGEVEIGYGIDPAYRNMGYTTEAVRALVQWAFKDPTCTAVTAMGTEKSNKASIRVLEKAGMRPYREVERTSDWRVDKEPGAA
jgi:RimJ/RimL family protein N-acetyltransferase